MSEGLEKLRSIGAQKIHEQTHIARKYVENLLHESFEGMQKVQLFGFISILEREYDVDLTPLKEHAVEYFELEEENFPKEEISYKKELLTSSKADRKRLYLIVALVLVGGVASLLYLSGTSEENRTLSQNRNGQTVSKSVMMQTIQSVETNETNETLSLQNETQTVQKPKVEKHHSFVIIPRTKVWLGIVDLDTGKKRQTITADSLELNASKNYLLTFGHGYIDMEVDGNKTSFKEPKNIKFLYKDGRLERIDNAEFRHYNKGRLW